MDKTININIAGTLFQIDEDAFRILRDYLQSINSRFRNVQGGHETIEDIESRISEIFQSQKGLAGVISKDNVEAMISIIGKPEDFDVNEEQPEQHTYTSQKRRMYRNPDDKIIGGVCSGIGAYVDTDPVLFRILFVISFFLGIGFFLYIVLWIALPEANTEAKRREMYGSSYHSAYSVNKEPDGSYSNRYNGSAKVGNAFNEIFRAIGSVLYIIFRIFMIMVGVTLVVTGFLTMVTLLMVFVFKMPWVFSNEAFDSSVIWFPDFLNYIVNPALAPWIIILTLVAIFLPMLALIYWGVKMIFWFRAKDGIITLICFILWVMSVTALSIMLFNEGVSFAESAKSYTQTPIPQPPDTLYIMSGQKIADLKYNSQFAVPDDDYTVFMDDSTRTIFICPDLRFTITDKENAKVEIRKRSSGRSRAEASRKSESLQYNYRISNDTLYLDEFFTVPSGMKWTADFVTINLNIPERTVLYFENSTEKLFRHRINIMKIDGDDSSYSRTDYNTEPWELGNKFWILTEDGLEEADKVITLQK
ncbi:MAG: PspC domain-containing protein [Bacteroidales bacterium]|nr:PspC domain-containing protein [Bacteroidales bacterium]